MRTYLPVTFTGAVLTTLLLATSALASDRKALNGTWTLFPAQSDFAGQPVVQTGTVTINDAKGVIVISRSFVYEGAAETFFYKDSQGSHNGSTIRTSKDLKTKTEWDDDVLKVTTTDAGAVTKERFSLSKDGSMKVTVDKPSAKPITLTFHRK